MYIYIVRSNGSHKFALSSDLLPGNWEMWTTANYLARTYLLSLLY